MVFFLEHEAFLCENTVPKSNTKNRQKLQKEHNVVKKVTNLIDGSNKFEEFRVTGRNARIQTKMFFNWNPCIFPYTC